MSEILTEREIEPECRAFEFGHKIYATYRTHPGAREKWLRNPDGSKRTFVTKREAIQAARQRVRELGHGGSSVTAGTDDEKKVAEALGVEKWLKSKREDIQAAKRIHRAGKKTIVVMRGRA